MSPSIQTGRARSEDIGGPADAGFRHAAAAFKWLRIPFRYWQRRTPSNEQIYSQALAPRGSPLLRQLLVAVNPN